MKKTLLFSFFLLCSILSYSQGWEKTFNAGWGTRTIVPSGDGGYIVAGDNFYMKISAAGNILWQNTTFGTFHSVCRTSDEALLLTGGDSVTTRLLKVTQTGGIIFDKYYSSLGLTSASYVAEINGSYLITGVCYKNHSSLYSMPSDSAKTFLLKTDENGDITWYKNYNSFGRESSYGYHIEADNNDYVIWGNRRIDSQIGGQVIKVDHVTGDTIWTKQMNMSSGVMGGAYILKGVATSEGGYISSGEGIHGNFNYTFNKYNSSYQLEWSKVYNIEDLSHTYNMKSVIQLNDGGYITGGLNAATDNSNSPYLVRLNSMGDTLWTRRFSSPDPLDPYSRVSALSICPDGGYIFCITAMNLVRIIKTDKSGNIYPNYIGGSFFIDENNNCMKDVGETGFPYAQVLVQPGNMIVSADSSGKFLFQADTGTYSVSALPSTLWETVCQNEYQVVFTNYNSSFSNADIALKVKDNCTWLKVDVSTPLQRRCFLNTYTISYSNEGNVAVPAAEIQIEFPPAIIPRSFSKPYLKANNIYTIPIGNLEAGSKGVVTVIDSVDCEVPLLSTVCVRAVIRPSLSCEDVPVGWDGSSIKVRGKCAGDTAIRFVIYNMGEEEGGGMDGTSMYRVYKDNNPVYAQYFQIQGGDSIVIWEDADGSTYRVEADQRPGHPGNSMPRWSVEGCGTNALMTLGFINSVPQDDVDDFVEEDCHQIIGSFDPNDKGVIPSGMTSQHFIRSDDELEYLIRFQNTGSDTAFTVRIKDVISDKLDMNTFKTVGGSHNYSYVIRGNEVEWIFRNILLPDSNKNEPKSHGFIKYKIRQKPGNADGTVIENTADIYFDYNEAVVTNTTSNTVNDSYNSVINVLGIYKDKKIGNLNIDIHPNPFQGQTLITVKDYFSEGTVIVYDLAGKEVLRKPLGSGKVIIESNELDKSLYLVKVYNKNEFLGTAKLMVE